MNFLNCEDKYMYLVKVKNKENSVNAKKETNKKSNAFVWLKFHPAIVIYALQCFVINKRKEERCFRNMIPRTSSL